MTNDKAVSIAAILLNSNARIHSCIEVKIYGFLVGYKERKKSGLIRNRYILVRLDGTARFTDIHEFDKCFPSEIGNTFMLPPNSKETPESMSLQYQNKLRASGIIDPGPGPYFIAFNSNQAFPPMPQDMGEKSP